NETGYFTNPFALFAVAHCKLPRRWPKIGRSPEPIHCITSLPRGWITLTATQWFIPVGSGSDTVPDSASNHSASTTPPSALASFSYAPLSGKNVCVMQNGEMAVDEPSCDLFRPRSGRIVFVAGS